MRLNRLSDCELEVMKILWDHEKGISPGELKRELKERRGRDYEKSTISTWLQRLKKKKWIESVPAERGVYIPLVKREDYEVMEIRLLTERLFSGNFLQMVAVCVRAGWLTKEDIEEIRNILDECKPSVSTPAVDPVYCENR